MAGGAATHPAWNPRSLRAPLSGWLAEEGDRAGSETQRAIPCERSLCESAGSAGVHSGLPADQQASAGPEFVEIMATERSLYGALDILASAVGSLSPLRVRVLSRRTRFVLLEGTMGKLPVRLSVQVSGKKGSGRLADGSPGYLLDQRLTVAFPTDCSRCSRWLGRCSGTAPRHRY